MSTEKFYEEVFNLIEDYYHNNNEKPKFLLISPLTAPFTIQKKPKKLKGLEIVLTDSLSEDELVVY